MAQFDVFRFVSVRPPRPAGHERTPTHFTRFSGTQRTPLHQAVSRLTGEDALDQGRALARSYRASPRYVSHPQAYAEPLTEVRAVRTVLRSEGQPTPEAVVHAVEDALGQGLRELVGGERFPQLKVRFWDSLYADVLAGAGEATFDEIAGGIRVLHLLERLAAGDENLPVTWSALQQVGILVPPDLVPAPRPRAVRQDLTPGESAVTQPPEQPGLTALGSIEAAISDVAATQRRNLMALAAASGPAADADAGSRRVRVRARARRGAAARDSGRAEVAARAPTEARPAPWRIQPQQLAPQTTAALQELGIDPAARSAPDIIAELERQASSITQALWSAALGFGGPGVQERSERRASASARYLATVGLASPADFHATLEDVRQSQDHPQAYRVLGIGDLHVVRESLLRYEEGEIAHIENVLLSEFRKRVHEWQRETEETVVTEQERLDERERDLQTTERFELQRETQRTIESSTSVQAGASVSASYGYVDVSAAGEFAYDSSRTESDRSASTFAREITDRALERITERTRTERLRRTLERTAESNTHAFDNTQGDGHVRGIYHWVDKIYQAQVVNYGQRLMLEFIIPEPAAFYIHARRNPVLAADAPVAPLEPAVPILTKDRNGNVIFRRDAMGQVITRPLQPGDLVPGSYEYWVSAYGVQDAVAPPPQWVFIATSLTRERQGPPSGRQGDADWSAIASEKGSLTVPPGLSRVYATKWGRRLRSLAAG